MRSASKSAAVALAIGGPRAARQISLAGHGSRGSVPAPALIVAWLAALGLAAGGRRRLGAPPGCFRRGRTRRGCRDPLRHGRRGRRRRGGGDDRRLLRARRPSRHTASPSPACSSASSAAARLRPSGSRPCSRTSFRSLAGGRALRGASPLRGPRSDPCGSSFVLVTAAAAFARVCGRSFRRRAVTPPDRVQAADPGWGVELPQAPGVCTLVDAKEHVRHPVGTEPSRSIASLAAKQARRSPVPT